MFKKRDRAELREIRHARVRKKISGTPEMPRLSVYRSLKHIQVQLIDDVAGKTLVAASTMEKGIQEHPESRSDSARQETRAGWKMGFMRGSIRL